jgi:polyisoprenoid-binding protein YceI
MSRRTVAILVLVALAVGGVIGGLVGVFIFIDLVGGTGEPSAPISAPTLSLDDLRTEAPPAYTLHTEIAQIGAQVAQVGTEVAQLSEAAAINSGLATEVAAINAQMEQVLANQQQAVAQAVTPSRTPRPTRTPTPTFTPSLTYTPSVTPTITPTAQPNQVLFRIVPEESQARFIVDELKPFIIGLVGSTDQVAGDFIVDFDHPPNSRVGTIRINVRTLRTDDPSRNESIRCCILLSERPEYEFSDFIPTAIQGLPDTVSIGDTVHFQITGDLSLRGITRSLTFDTTLMLVSETEITGLATTTIQRANYDLLEGGLIEHGVSEAVTLEIEFVARAV